MKGILVVYYIAKITCSLENTFRIQIYERLILGVLSLSPKLNYYVERETSGFYYLEKYYKTQSLLEKWSFSK